MASREDHMEMRMGSILYDYDAQEDDELTIRAGERFHLVRSFDDGWWHVQVNQDDGMIPSNFALLDSDGGAATDQEDHLSSRQLSSAKPLSSSHASNKNLMQDIRSPDRVSSKDPFEPMLVDHEDRSSPEKVIVKKLSKKTLKQPLPVPLLQEEDSPRDLSLVIPPELDKTPRETGGAPSSSNTLSNQSPELRRLKDLREQATLKIDALRSAVSQYEHESDVRMSAKQRRSTSAHEEDHHISGNNDSADKLSLDSPSLRKNKSEQLLRRSAHHQGKSHHVHSAHPSSSQRAYALPHHAHQSNVHDSVTSSVSTSSPHSVSSSSGHPSQPVAIDATSMDYISKLVNEKIARALSAHDKRLLQQVQSLVEDTVAQLSPQQRPSADPRAGVFHSKSGASSLEMESESNDFDRPSHAKHHAGGDVVRRHSHGGGGAAGVSKIPRIKLPKISSSQQGSHESNSARSNDKASKMASVPVNGIALPPMGNKGAKAVDASTPSSLKSKRPDDNQMILSEDGVQYAQCRSVVYPSAQDLEMAKQRKAQNANSAPAPPKLVLSHVLGYDGDPNRHGNSITGKNVLFLTNSHIIYPAAAIVTIMDLSNAHQSFFMGHSDDVVCLASHPLQTCVASAQIGAESNIIQLWDYSGLIRDVQSLSSANYEVVIPSSTRGVTSLSFSSDGEFLLACGLEDVKTVYIFDWQREVLLVSAKIGQVDVTKFVFNPYSFVPFLDDQRVGEMKYSSGLKAKDAPLLLPGCYTLISYGVKQVKFWTLKQEVQYAGAEAGNGGRDYRGKKFRENTVKYVLEGGLGGGIKKASNIPEYTCSAIVRGEGPSTSQVLLGATNGSIYIWQHVEDDPIVLSNVGGVEDNGNMYMSWAARGKLLLVVAEAHDGPLVDMDYFIRPLNSRNTNAAGDQFSDGRYLATSDSAGTINIWAVQGVRGGTKVNRIPLEHRGGIQLDESRARSLCFNETGDALIIGTASNSISLMTLTNPSPSSEDGSIGIELSKLLVGHNGKVRRLAVHPLVSSIFASVSSDKTIRIWDGYMGRHLCSLQVDFGPTAISFSMDGSMLAIGGDHGVLVVVRSEGFNRLISLVAARNGRCEEYLENFLAVRWEAVESKVIANSIGGTKKALKKIEIIEIRYSPLGDILAVGCKDNLIHIMSHPAYKHLGSCRGHSSQVRNLDFSEDGKVLRSCDASKELLFWDIESFQRITQPSVYRNQRWKTSSCIFGWGLQGIFNRFDGEKVLPADSEINCISRSQNGRIVVAAGSNILRSAIKAFNYPALPSATPAQYGGHSSPVLDLAFIETPPGTRLVSAGGNDSCLFLWDVAVN